MRKGQAAVELTAVAFLMLLVLFLLFEFGQVSIAQNTTIAQLSEARDAVEMLAKAAIEVYNEGVGARRRVYVTIPDRADPSRIIIENSTIVIGVYVGDGVTDVSSTLNFPVRKGYFPTTPGSYWIPVTAKEGYVLIGSALEVDPTNLYIELLPNNSTNRTIAFTNYGTSDMNVSLELSWVDPETHVSINETQNLSFTLLPGASNSLEVKLYAAAYMNTSLGLHSGYISITTNTSEDELLPVVINVVSSPTPNGTSYLTLSTYTGGYTSSEVLFSQFEVVYYQIKSYNSTDDLVNSTVLVRIHSPTSLLMDEKIYTPNAGTGTYRGNYTLPPDSPTGFWSITVHDASGATAKSYFTVTPLPISTAVGLTEVVPFYPNQRAICRDGTGVLHIVWLKNSSAVGYARSTTNGANFSVAFWTNETPASLGYPHISCDGNNIVVVYSNGSLVMKISQTNGINWETKVPRASGVDIPLVESRGARIYVVYKNADAYADINFFNSSDGGATWSNDVTIFDGYVSEGEAVTYYQPSLAVDGNGGTADRIHVAAEQTSASVGGTSYYIYYKNSTNSGATWASYKTLTTYTPQWFSPSITFNGSNVYVVYYSYNNKTYFNSSSDYGASWAGEEIDKIADASAAQYPSVTVDDRGYPVAFWQQNSTSENKRWNIVYRVYNGTHWLPVDGVYYTTADVAGDNVYVNTKYNFGFNRIELVYRNGTSSPYQIVYSSIRK